METLTTKTKTAVYLPIQSNHSQNEQSLQIKMDYGYAGYGIYIELLQRLTASPARTLAIAGVKALAYAMHISLAELQPILDNFLTIEGDVFFSKELNESMIYFDEKYNKDSAGGKKTASLLTPEERSIKAKNASNIRWNKGNNDNNANGMLTLSINDANPLAFDANNRIEKNRREENKKEKNVSVPETNFSPSENDIENDNSIVEIKSKYFNSDSTSILKNMFNKFNLENPNSDLPFEVYELIQILILEHKSNYEISSNDELNSLAIKSKFTVIDLDFIKKIYNSEKNKEYVETKLSTLEKFYNQLNPIMN